MPDFVDGAVKEIDDRLRELKDEVARLEAARSALTGGGRRGGRRAGSAARARTARSAGARPASARPRSARSTRESATQTGTGARGSRSGDTRATQALELVRQRPGITIPEIASAMKIQPNYLYRVLPRLASEGQVTRDGQGWRPTGRR
jgi:hypothetical protein